MSIAWSVDFSAIFSISLAVVMFLLPSVVPSFQQCVVQVSKNGRWFHHRCGLAALALHSGTFGKSSDKEDDLFLLGILKDYGLLLDREYINHLFRVRSMSNISHMKIVCLENVNTYLIQQLKQGGNRRAYEFFLLFSERVSPSKEVTAENAAEYWCWNDCIRKSKNNHALTDDLACSMLMFLGSQCEESEMALSESL